MAAEITVTLELNWPWWARALMRLVSLGVRLGVPIPREVIHVFASVAVAAAASVKAEKA